MLQSVHFARHETLTQVPACVAIWVICRATLGLRAPARCTQGRHGANGVGLGARAAEDEVCLECTGGGCLRTGSRLRRTAIHNGVWLVRLPALQVHKRRWISLRRVSSSCSCSSAQMLGLVPVQQATRTASSGHPCHGANLRFHVPIRAFLHLPLKTIVWLLVILGRFPSFPSLLVLPLRCTVIPLLPHCHSFAPPYVRYRYPRPRGTYTLFLYIRFRHNGIPFGRSWRLRKGSIHVNHHYHFGPNRNTRRAQTSITEHCPSLSQSITSSATQSTLDKNPINIQLPNSSHQS